MPDLTPEQITRRLEPLGWVFHPAGDPADFPFWLLRLGGDQTMLVLRNDGGLEAHGMIRDIATAMEALTAIDATPPPGQPPARGKPS